MKNLLVIFIFAFIASCTNKQSNIHIDLQEEIFFPKHYIVPKCSTPIKIDGIANEDPWLNTSFSDPFIDIEGIKKPKYDTKVKLLWDDEYLYVYAIMEEPHIWGDLTNRDTIIYFNNAFEVLLDPSQTTYNYCEIEVNSLNTIWDLKINKPYRSGGNGDSNWNLTNLKTAINITGTINNPKDVDSHWSVEMAIPIAPLMKLKSSSKDSPKNGEQWRANFLRVNWGHNLVNGRYQRKKLKGEYSPAYFWSWTKQGVVNIHEPEKWGILQFSDQTSGKNIEFIYEKDFILKQAAFGLFRLTQFGSLKYLLDKKAGYKELIKVTISKDKDIVVLFEKTKAGFNYQISSNDIHTTYIIDHNGILSTIS